MVINIDWDHELSTETDVNYRTRSNIYRLKEIKLQPLVLSEEHQEPFEVHDICEASEEAYAASVV